ncbi:MAG: hypothetical protein ACLQLG_18980 [Thermoguttaceae bacterium]
MNCFNHRAVPAVGLCKSCGKALCGDCLTELPNGLACKGKCEPRVNWINRTMDSSAKVMSSASSARQRAAAVLSGLLMGIGLLLLFVAIGFLVFAVWAYFEFGGFLSYFLGLVGLFMLSLGIVMLSRRKQYLKPAEEKE